ncbi:MAG: helix-turn-helix transcriptional regulator [Duncaniella sp.]|nr:helix-turn-helix transcriptional regulator [Duncaniella sp.]
MSKFHELDSILRNQDFDETESDYDFVVAYAKSLAMIEQSIVIVSDLRNRFNRIFAGRFADELGIKCCLTEDTIWEKEILGLMTEDEREEKFLAELRFLHYLRQHPQKQRGNLYLISRLRFKAQSGKTVNVQHRMYYIHDEHSDSVRFAVCIYEPLVAELPCRSMAVNSVTGIKEELTTTADNSILSKREKQVLALIDNGKTSNEIAASLCISRNTVSRHRQEILAKLQVKNSVEACHRAKSLHII